MMMRVIIDFGSSRLKTFLAEMVLIKNICSLLAILFVQYPNNQWPDYILIYYFRNGKIQFCSYVPCDMKYSIKYFIHALYHHILMVMPSRLPKCLQSHSVRMLIYILQNALFILPSALFVITPLLPLSWSRVYVPLLNSACRVRSEGTNGTTNMINYNINWLDWKQKILYLKSCHSNLEVISGLDKKEKNNNHLPFQVLSSTKWLNSELESVLCEL